MEVYLLIEPEFQNGSWCNSMLKGIHAAFIHKKRSLITVQNLEDIAPKEEAFLILVGSNPNWVKGCMQHPNITKVHPIILSCLPYYSFPGIYSFVTSDSKSSMDFLLNYFKNCGRTSPALYGVNPFSLSNIAKKERFLANSYYQVDAGDVYENNGSLDECFENFCKNISRYDSVICVNDYVAIHLVKKMEQLGLTAEKLLPVSYGSTLLSAHFYPNLLTVSTCYEDFGKAALSICETLSKNKTIQNMSIYIKLKTNFPESSTQQAHSLPLCEPEHTNEENDNFYKDPKIQQMLLVESMLSKCDKTDFEILNRLLAGQQYEQIAEKCFIALNTVKYRVKQMSERCHCKNRKELLNLIIGSDI